MPTNINQTRRETAGDTALYLENRRISGINITNGFHFREAVSITPQNDNVPIPFLPHLALIFGVPLHEAAS